VTEVIPGTPVPPGIPARLDQLAGLAIRALREIEGIQVQLADRVPQAIPALLVIKEWLAFPATLARRVQRGIKAPPEAPDQPAGSVTLGVQAARVITETRDQLGRLEKRDPTDQLGREVTRAILAQLEPLVLRVQAEPLVTRETPDRPASPAPSEPDRPDRPVPPDLLGGPRATRGIQDLRDRRVTPERLGQVVTEVKRDRLVREVTQVIRDLSEMTGLQDQLVRQGTEELPGPRATQVELVRRVISAELVRLEMTGRRVLKELQETLGTQDQQVKDLQDQLAELATRVPLGSPDPQA
jgi:hypothetical protein